MDMRFELTPTPLNVFTHTHAYKCVYSFTCRYVVDKDGLPLEEQEREEQVRAIDALQI